MKIMNKIEKRNGNNDVFIIGEMMEDFHYSHMVKEQKFYQGQIAIPRKSGELDFVSLIVSEKMIVPDAPYAGEFLAVTGEYRSCHKYYDGKSHVVLYLSASDLKVVTNEDVYAQNQIYLDGYICKKSNYRTTKTGHPLMDGIIAINRPGGKSDYIPCLFWNRHANELDNMSIGTHVRITGRIQSRTYTKMCDDETKTYLAYEVSIKQMDIIQPELMRDHTMVAVG